MVVVTGVNTSSATGQRESMEHQLNGLDLNAKASGEPVHGAKGSVTRLEARTAQFTREELKLGVTNHPRQSPASCCAVGHLPLWS